MQNPVGPTVQIPKAKSSIAHKVFEFFSKGHGYRFSAAAVDLHYWFWRARHRNASFGDYYAATVANSLRKGSSHKTLGDKPFLSAGKFSKPQTQAADDFARRGVALFEFLIKLGITPADRCIDYGCGSLWIGQHFIRFLDPGHYLGLDLVDDFYRAGLKLIPPDLVALKTPSFGLIDEHGLQEGADFKPDVIFSISVLKHVPENELQLFFYKILSMAKPETRVFVSFNKAARTMRTGASIWDHSPEHLTRCVSAVNPSLSCSFVPIQSRHATRTGSEPTMLVVGRRR